ncbi:hypothetical protein ABXJ76_18720 [Methylobacter sp. G7]|uniref:hypothetical protein n=1 Tax=Methylobacter sp. G7 TaxID=3230117 RepID=UPI003D8058AD
MIVDLFSHKIHSSGDEWPEKLAEIAAIFNEFNGQLFNRNTIEERLQRISPRASYLAKDAASKPRTAGGRLDVSKFRDEISAYPAYLGLYYLEASSVGWIVRITETTKRFLIREEPDVASFLRLQLPLFQYPSAMGAAYKSHSTKLRIQANSRDRTLNFVKQGIHFSPVRTIAVALQADAYLRGISVLSASVSYNEIFGLANCPLINKRALPSISDTAVALDDIRNNRLGYPDRYESRFHTLKHTEIFLLGQGHVRLRSGVNEADRNQLIRQLEAIASISAEFKGFDNCADEKDLREVIASGEWGQYFDGVRMLPSHTVEALTKDTAMETAMPVEPAIEGETSVIPFPVAEIYPFRPRTGVLPTPKPYDRRKELADPELTKIKRQRRNLAHKELIDMMESWLRRLGASPQENEHIDLFAKIPGDGSFIFEMKSGGESLLEQIRKGLSQLYEYRYRYRSIINDQHVSLCLVLPENPNSIPWITDYLCSDREINICWFDSDDGALKWPILCDDRMAVLEWNVIY